MLIRFVASNFLSLGKECEFNMLAAPLKSHTDHVYYNQTKRLKVLKGAAIYGANGAGKSNIVKAIYFLRDTILAGSIPPEISQYKYKLDETISRQPTTFDVEYEWNKKFYAYHLEILNDIISEEGLYELGFQNDDKVLFERKLNSQTNKITVSIGEKKSPDGRTKMLAGLLSENILDNTKLLLSNHSMLNDSKISNAFSWFRNGIVILFPNSTYSAIAKPLSDSEEFNRFANSIITTLDTGVAQLGVETIPFDKFFREENSADKRQLAAKLDAGKTDIPVPMKNGLTLVASVDGNGGHIIKKPVTYHQNARRENVTFEIFEESDGTRRLLDIIPAIDLYLKGATVVIDEVNESLHPSLLKTIMAKIMGSSPADGGQFIVTTHESNLLDYDLFRQDEIWFVEKNNGSTEIYPLTDFKPRADLQLEKGYLMGRFGAIPFLANLKDLNWQQDGKN